MPEDTTPEKLDVNTEEGRAALDQIQANIERARVLATEGNDEALKALNEETESVISALSGKGSIRHKKEWRDAWTAAVEEGKAAMPAAEVKKVTEGVVMGPSWENIPGVPELVNAAAEKLAEGVKLNLKGAKVAEEVAGIVFEAWCRVENSAGRPDILGDTDEAKKITKATLAIAGKGFKDTYDNKKALQSLTRSVQYYRSDVRAKWLRSLDGDDEIATGRRALMGKVLKDKPEDGKASDWVAKAYGTSTVGEGEAKAAAYRQKKELEASGGTPEPSADATEDEEIKDPDEYLTKTVDRMLRDINRTKTDVVGKASKETRAAQRKRLEKALEGLRQMIAATL
jgi:hypothetical protein